MLKKYNFSGRNSAMLTNAENISKSVYILLKDERYMKHLGAFGRSFAEKEFEPRKNAAHVELVFKNAQKNAKMMNSFPSLVFLSLALIRSGIWFCLREIHTGLSGF